MKKRVLPFVLVTFFVAGLGMILFLSASDKNSRNNRMDGVNNSPGDNVMAYNYLSLIRNNQATGILDPKDVLAAREQAELAGTLKAGNEFDFKWFSYGPNNIGGRTRALVFDKRDEEFKTIYAAGVTGGVFKTTNLGATWNNIDGSENRLYVTCMIQAPDNAIYAGTGEGFNIQNYSSLGSLGYTGGFIGNGIFKITGNDNIAVVPGTQPTPNSADAEWAYVNRIAMASDGNLWAAINTGVKVYNGTEWMYAQYTDSTGTHDLTGLAYDVKAGSNGVVIASVEGKAYVSAGGSYNGFVCVSTGEEDMLPATGAGRIEFAIAPSDPDIVYAMVTNSSLKSLLGVYLSEDKGASWRVVGPGGSTALNILGSSYMDGATEKFYYQGDLSSVLHVFPQNPYRILAGGVNLWEGTKVNETGFYSWSQKSFGDLSFELDPTYVHVDHHVYAFRPGVGNEFYIGSNGGVYQATITGDNYTYKPRNTNYITSHFFNVAPASFPGLYMGGTQDNGSLLVREANNLMYGSDMWLFNFLKGSGDGGACAFSSMVKTISNQGGFAPVTLYSTGPNRNNDVLVDRMRRSETLGADYSLSFLDEDMVNTSFITPMVLWEGFNDQNSEIFVTWIADRGYQAGERVVVRSHNYEYPFYYELESALNAGDTIMIKDIVTTRTFVGTTDELWMTTEAIQFGVEPEWFMISDKVRTGFDGTPSCMTFSSCANYLFVGTYGGKLYRISNIAYTYDYDRADVRSVNCIIATSELDFMEGGNTQAITSIAVDPSDPEKVLVTLGNYGNTDYVYYTENSLNDEPAFVSVHGNTLPKMPVYASLLEMNPANNLALIGTDEGVYVSDDPASGVWYPSMHNIGKVPVLDIKQQTVYKERIVLTYKDPGTNEDVYETFWETMNYGFIYVATYGKGVYGDSTFFIPLGVEEPISQNKSDNLHIGIYPNPAGVEATLSLYLEKREPVDVWLYDLSGRLVLEQRFSNTVTGKNDFRLNLGMIGRGTYVVHVSASGRTGTGKLIVQ